MMSDSMLNEVKSQLGDNYKQNDDELLKSMIDRVTTVALSISNRSGNLEDIKLLSPYIIDCVIADYLNRGGEGFNSLSESGRSSSFKDTREVMRKNIIADGLRVCF